VDSSQKPETGSGFWSSGFCLLSSDGSLTV
jgi:hypothetical protein